MTAQEVPIQEKEFIVAFENPSRYINEQIEEYKQSIIKEFGEAQFQLHTTPTSGMYIKVAILSNKALPMLMTFVRGDIFEK